MKTWLFSLTALLLGSAHLGAQPAYPRPQLLLEAKDLQAGADKFVILDARSKAKYTEGHIPGAVWVDHDAWSKDFGINPNDKEWPGRASRLGIDNVKPVAVYDDGGVKDAARIWYILRYLGVKDVRLVNGGLAAWKAEKLPLSDKLEAIPLTVFKAGPPLASLHADQDRVLNFLKEKKTQIIDARSEKEYCGDTKTAKRSGSMPGALHLEWNEAIDPKTKKFKSADEVTKLFQDAGIDLSKPSVTYCQSGGRASVMVFTMELMGAKEVANYYRSWSEWGNAEATPVVTPKRK
jgi:thiosulfate/3-mercaptopyruvate sulfurtransferase